MIRRSLAEIKTRARDELADNPTITVYKFVNGAEKRRAANPFAGMRVAMRRLADSMAGAAKAFEGFNRHAHEALKGAAR